MKSPAQRCDSRLMREMFTAIAPRYDFITRAFSYGMDRRWKELGVARAPLPEDAVVLDLACGTGGFFPLVIHPLPPARALTAHPTEPTFRPARNRRLPATGWPH